MGQREARQAAAAGQRHVGLAVAEGAAAQVDVHPVEGLALALVDGDRPAEPQRQLLVGADLLPGDLLRAPVVLVDQVLPGRPADLVLRPVLQLHRGPVVAERRDDAPGAVDPAPVRRRS